MNALWEIVLSNTLLVVVLAAGVAVAGRFWKNPLGLHLLWLLVLLKFITPPLMVIGLPLPVEPSTAVSDHAVSPSPGTEVTSPGEDVSSSNEMMSAAMDRQIGPLLSEKTVAHPDAVVYAPPQVAPRERFPWLIVLTWIWCLGIVCTVLWQARRILRFQRLLRAAEPASSDLLQMAAEVGQQLGLRQVPAIRMLPVRISPLVWSPGFRPQLVLPMDLFQRLEPAAQSSILAHELAHVRRKDHLARLLELLVSTLFWWHPVAWWACRELKQIEELCCDAMVVAMAPSSRKAYVTALLDTLDFLCDGSIAAPLGATAAKSPILLARRIAMMKNRTGVIRLTFGRVALLVLLAAVPMGIAFAAKSPPSESAANGPTEATESTVASPQIAASEAAKIPDPATSHGNDQSSKPAAAKPADEVSPASDQSATKEGLEKAKTITWKETVFDDVVDKDGKILWVESWTHRRAFKAPGLYVRWNLDHEGKITFFCITDNVGLRELQVDHQAKEATLREMAVRIEDPRGPFGDVTREQGGFEWVGKKVLAGREVNVFRCTRKDDRRKFRGEVPTLGWTQDYWVDAKTKRLVRIQWPGADIYDPEKDPLRNNPRGEHREGLLHQGIGWVLDDIVYDAKLDDPLFSLEPPKGYSLKIDRRPQVTEKDMVEHLRLMAEYYNNQFPDRYDQSAPEFDKAVRGRAVPAWLPTNEEAEAVERKPERDRTPAQKKMGKATRHYILSGLNLGPFRHFIRDHTVEGTWQYLGQGVNLGDKGRIVCWYKMKGANNPNAYRVVYGDLSVKDVAPEDLPLPVENDKTSTAKPADEVSPASDQSATKGGVKTESKPAPIHGLTAEPNADEAKAVAEIEKLGGKVTVDEKSQGKPAIGVDLNGTQVTDVGLKHLKGFKNLQSLCLEYTKVTDAGMEHLKGLTKLQDLSLGGTMVSDAGLEHLRGLTNLQMLHLDGTNVTDAGLKHLKGWTKLRSLAVRKKVTDAGLKQLKGMTTLQSLMLGGRSVTDAGLVYLKELTSLQLLDLEETNVTDAGLEHLKALTHLQTLGLSSTEVTDAGLEHLKGLTNLQTLYLIGTGVTDAGLERLKGATQLQTLDLRGTKVTDAGVKKLQQALPNCIIYHKMAESAPTNAAPAVPKGNDQSGKTSAAKPADEVSPASDHSATKEGAKTESKPVPTHGLAANQSADQGNVHESTITGKGGVSDITSLFQEAGRLKPNDAESRNRIGIAMIKAGIGLPAIELLRKALQIKPDFAEAHNNLGYALLRPGMDPGRNRKEAIQHFEKALSLKPDYPEAHNNLGLALIAEYRASRAKEAIEHYQQALRFKPDDAEIHYNLGIAFSFVGQSEKEIEQLEQALRLRPAYPDADFNLAVILTKTGRLTEAIKHYRQAIQLRPDFFEAYDNMAEAYSRMNRMSEAIEATQKALGIAKSGEAYSRLTKVLEARIEYYRAVQASWSK